MTVKLSEIEKAAEGATPGPWSADLDKHGETRGIWPEGPEEIVVGCFVVADGYDSVDFTAGTDENLVFIAASRTAIPALTAALRDVLALHPESPMWEVDPVNGTWRLDAAGEKIPVLSVCLECTPADTAAAFEDCEWDDGYETVYWPCPTVRAITAHVDPT